MSTTGMERPCSEGSKYLAVFVCTLLILTGFTGIMFFGSHEARAAGSGFVIPTGSHWYMEDLVANSSSNVTNSSGAFVFHGNVTISAGASLTVNSSKFLKFDDDLSLIVLGSLVLNGLDGLPVTVCANSTHAPGGFAGIVFQSTTNSSYINHTVIYNARNALTFTNSIAELLNVTIKDTLESALMVDENSTLTIEDLAIRSCGNGIKMDVGLESEVNISINDTTVENVTGWGFVIEGNGKGNVTMSNASVENCSNGINISGSVTTHLSHISISNSTGDGLKLYRWDNYTLEDIDIISCAVGLNASELVSLTINGTNGARCSGSSDIYYRIFNVGEFQFQDLTVVNNNGPIFQLENITNISIMNSTISSPDNLPIRINNSRNNMSMIIISESTISNTSGGIFIIGSPTGTTEVGITNTTFSDYGSEYINATDSLVFLLNSTFVINHTGLNHSYLWAEYFLSVDVYNITGEDLCCMTIVVRDKNETSYRKDFQTGEVNGIWWENITYVEMNATNILKKTYNYPMNVSAEKWGYFAANISIEKPNNYSFVFNMNDTVAPVSSIETIGIEYRLPDMLFINDTTKINITAEDSDGSGIKYIYYDLQRNNITGGWKIFNTPFSPAKNGSGNYTLYYYSVDYENNTETTMRKNITVDYSTPDFQGVELEGAYRFDDSHIWNVSRNTLFTINFTDVSGINHYWTEFNYSYSMVPDTFFFDWEVPDGPYNITLGAKDNLGYNHSGEELKVYLDNTFPVVTESIDIYYVNGVDNYFFVRNDTHFSLDAMDTASGLKMIYYELDSVEHPYNETLKISMEGLSEGYHNMKIGAEDNILNKGNSVITGARQTGAFYIDISPPTVTPHFIGESHELSGTDDVYIKSSTVISLQAEDVSGYNPQSGVKDVWYHLDGGNFTWEDELSIYKQGAHNLVFGAVDNIGNNHTQGEITIVLNNTVPAPPTLNILTNRTRYENINIEGKAPVDCTIKLIVNYKTVYEDIIPDEDGNFSVPILLAPGENVLTAYSVDYFNRLSLSTTPVIIVLDKEAPLVTGSTPAQEALELAVSTPITVRFNEPLSEATVTVLVYNGMTNTWEIVEGNSEYVQWNLFASFILPDGETLRYESKYRIKVDMIDNARNFATHEFYNRNDRISYSFITKNTTHIYNQLNYVIKSQSINISYEKWGEELLRFQLLASLDSPSAPVPEYFVSTGVYFNVSLDSQVNWVAITLNLNLDKLKGKLLYKHLWDINNLSFYKMVNGAWEELNTAKLSTTSFKYSVNNPGDTTLTLAAFAPDLDWDGDREPIPFDLFPLDRDEWADSDGDGVGDEGDPEPYNSKYKADDDEDHIPNSWENFYGLDPFNSIDGDDDLDGDGLSNLEEYKAGTLPNHWDTDGDGLPDGWEITEWRINESATASLDPLSDKEDNGRNGDPDGDGATNYEEYQQDRNPFVSDRPVKSEEENEPNYTVMIIIIVTLIVLIILLVYGYFYKKRKERKEAAEATYYDLEDLGTVEFPSGTRWGGMEPAEVFELDYLDSSPELFDLDFGAMHKDISILDEELYEDLLEQFNVFTVPGITCSNCGTSVDLDVKSCPECERKFEEEPDIEAGLDEDELDKLLGNLETATCSECGESVSPEDKKCEECGSVFLEKGEMQCSNCKGIIEKDAVECPHCSSEFE